MDFIQYSKETAINSGVDLTYFIINYIDHELITFDLISKLKIEEHFVESAIEDTNVLGVTFKIECDNVEERFNELKQAIESNSVVNVLNKTYNLSISYDDSTGNIKLLISPYDYPGLSWTPPQFT